jgi:hypothetical protein
MMNGKDLKGSARDLIEASGSCIEGLRKTTKTLSQDRQCVGRDTNRAPANTCLEHYRYGNLLNG